MKAKLLIGMSFAILFWQETAAQGKPTNLRETFSYLDNQWDDTAKYDFMKLPEIVATIRLHHSVGMGIRNAWGLWGNSELAKYFRSKGILNADNMSAIILKSYHQYLNNKPVWFETLDTVKLQYLTPLDSAYLMFLDSSFRDQVNYYPVGDTVLIYLPGTEKKLSKKYRMMKGTALIRSHKEGKLEVEILSTRPEKGRETEKKKGDIFEVHPDACVLIPPKGWVFNK